MSTPKTTLYEDPLHKELGGPRRFPLHGVDRVWLLGAGYVDLFAAAVDDDGVPSGAFHHLARLSEGDALFGVDPDPAPGVALIASLGPQAKLHLCSCSDRDAADLPGLAEDEFLSVFERWAVVLCGIVTAQVTPKKFQTIALGERLAVGDEPRVVLPVGDSVWIVQQAGRSAVLGNSDLVLEKGSPPYPLPKFSWIEAQPDAEIVAVDPRRLIETGDVFAGRQLFHKHILACLAAVVGRLEEKERERLLRKSGADDHSLRAAVSELASPLGTTPLQISIRHDMATPLLQACEAIGKATGIEFRPPTEMRSGAAVRDPVETIARASGIRTRVVALKGEWWKEGGQALLAFAKEDKRPLALIPKGSHRYTVYDPKQGRMERLSADALELNPFAYTFYRPFPRKAIGARDLVAFGLLGCRQDAVRVALLGAASGALALLTPVATQVIFDSLIPGARRPELLLLCGFLVTAAVASALFTLTRGFAALRIESRMSCATQAAVWDRLLSLPLAFFRDYPSGDLATRSMAVDQIRQLLTGNTLASILSGTFSVFSFGLLFYYSSRLALLFTALTAVASAATFGVGYFQVRLQRQSSARAGLLSGMVLEFITGIAKLRVAGAESRAFSLWVRQFAQQKKTDFNANRLSNALTVFNSVFPVIALAATFLAYAYIRGGATGASLSTGAFLAFLAASTQFLSGILSLSAASVSLLKIIPLYERAAPILEGLPESDETRAEAGPLSGRVEASHLVFRYRPDSPSVLKDVSFTVAPGEFVAFVGPSGCGKSTLFRVLLGFEQPEAGAVYYDGQDLAGLDLRSVRRQMGVVLQSGSLIHGTILENIRGTNGSVSVDDACAAIRLAGLEEDVRRLPMGIHTYIREGGGGLSGGQRQRMLIARAIVAKPSILLLDEATSALDNTTQALVSRSLSALKSTRIVIAHRLSTIVDADRIIVMEKGRIIQQGAYSELMNQVGLFRELAARQLV